MRRKIRASFCTWCAGLMLAWAAESPPGASTPAQRAEAAYRDARAALDADPTNNVLAWKFGSACFDECEFSQSNVERARVAKEGVQACELAVSRDDSLAAAHYYLGLDLGELARTKIFGALSLVDRMETEWKTALKLDENFDFAGADRNLGSLYLSAPGWPLSIGSKTNARMHLLRAAKLHPEYPENLLNLLEAYVKWNEHDDGVLEAKAVEKLLPEARKKFTGPYWESYWEDWTNRLTTLEGKLNPAPEATPPHSRK